MEQSRSILAIFAHPDDETFGPGGTIAKYARSGYPVFLATATKGEAGMLGDPPIATRENVGDVRARELVEAAGILGIKEVFFMGFRDGELAKTDMGLLVERAVYAVRRFRPLVLVTFGPDGISGHPDHVRISEVSREAFELCGRENAFPSHFDEGLSPWEPKKLYHFVIPDVFVRRSGARLHGVSREEITTIIDVSDFLETKIEAFRCHRTQAKDAARILSRPGYREFARKEYFVLASWRGGPYQLPEDDLFSGL